eukprot:m.27739 g.27739  ORF g.27739 m.27739 type:complete len:392 (+) comp8967_c0_seq1:177-1352(+)
MHPAVSEYMSNATLPAKDEIAAAKQATGFPVPKELMQLAGFSGGTALLCKKLPNGHFLRGPIEVEVVDWASMKDPSDTREEWGVPANALPFAGDGHFWFCYLKSRKIGLWASDDSKMYPIAANLREFLETLQEDVPEEEEEEQASGSGSGSGEDAQEDGEGEGETSAPAAASTSDSSSMYMTAPGARGDKFWSCKVVGTETQVRYGNVGADGQESIKDHGTEEKAQKFMAKTAEQKRKKGYADADPAAAAASAPAAKKKPAGKRATGAKTTAATGAKKSSAAAKKEGTAAATKKKSAGATAAKKPKKAAAAATGDGGAKSKDMFDVYLEAPSATGGKFWGCKVNGSETTVTFGKVGSAGKDSVKDHGTEEKAKKFMNKTADQKRTKGYDEV